MSGEQRREEILDAAERVLTRGGTLALTIEAVAREAGVSKGGFLYHFRSKSDLIAALVARLVSDTDESLERWSEGPGTYTRAYIRSGAHDVRAEDAEDVLRRWSVILASSTEPTLQAPISEAFERWMELKPDVDEYPLRAMIARLASDGLWWNAQFVKAFRDPKLTRQIEAALIAYAEGEDGEPA